MSKKRSLAPLGTLGHTNPILVERQLEAKLDFLLEQLWQAVEKVEASTYGQH